MSETEKITIRLLQAIHNSGYSYAELEKRSGISNQLCKDMQLELQKNPFRCY